jgi:hypothetical protein
MSSDRNIDSSDHTDMSQSIQLPFLTNIDMNRHKDFLVLLPHHNNISLRPPCRHTFHNTSTLMRVM